ncbi:MAG: LysR family transcriptional regulator [Cardiobacteriaceae bacterium]|nr:LysR family transcriptional regulator [Cardiobacteriaceae bacterium]
MDWNDLRYFITLVEKETLTASADALDVQHSTVARRIRQLEDTLGLPLFDHLGKRYRLTAAGERLYRHAREIHKDINALARIAREEMHSIAEVGITAPPAVLRSRIAPQLPVFYRENPRIRLRLHGNTALDNLHDRAADIALRFVRPQAPDLVVRRLCAIRCAFYASKSYVRTPREHWQYLTLSTDNPLSQWAKSRIDPARILLACNDFALIKSAIAAGLGIGLLPMDDAEPDWQPIAIQGKTPDTRTETLYLVMHEDVRRSPAVRRVADFLIAILTEE